MGFSRAFGGLNGSVDIEPYPPLFEATIAIPEEGYSSFISFDSTDFFPDYDPVVWDNDFIAFLNSLGSFNINWGDGLSETVSYLTMYGDGISHNYAEGTYTFSMTSTCAITDLTNLFTSINKIEGIKYLSLDKSPGISTLPSLKKSMGLMYLSVSTSGLTIVPSLSGLVLLKQLNIGGSNITNIPSLFGLSRLESLNISTNNLSVFPSLTGLSKLKQLTAGSNNFVTPPDLTGLHSLEILYLDGCTLLESPPDVSGCVNLTQLDVGGDTILVNPPDVSGLINLRIFRLDGCTSLTSSPSVNGLTSLEYLLLSRCSSLDIEDIDGVLGEFSVLYPNLLEVDVRQNPGVTPTPSVKSAAIEANPQATFNTN